MEGILIMKQYETSDIWTASALITLGNKCKAENVGYLKNGNPKYKYMFDETPELKENLYKIETKDLSIDVKTFKENYLMLKNLTFNQ